MVKFTTEEICEMMRRPDDIRNISVIAHVDHGKSTLTDSLIAKAGMMAMGDAGKKRMTDTHKFEQEHGVTVKSTSVSLCYDREESDGEKRRYLINLIDSPGHVDFSSEVTAALRVTDGALVVVDCVESVCVQTETVLRQAITERIKPVLFMNKLDRVFLETCQSLEESYVSFRNTVESVNVICATYSDSVLRDIECAPAQGKVGFGSGLHAWGFTLADFAKMYASRFGLSESKMAKKLWGNNYFDAESRRWTKKNEAGKLERGFCEFVLKPIKLLIDAIMAEDKETYEPILESLRLRLDKRDLAEVKKPKDLVKLVMRTWLPAGDALLSMITEHLPPPTVAQAYRTEKLYTGPLDSVEAGAIAKCDADAPVSMYVSKMVPTGEKGRFVAFGRVFSGTVRAGTEVRILGNDYEHGSRKGVHVKKLQRVLLMMGGKTESVSEVPCGNVCGLVGVDKYLDKSGTITGAESFHPFVAMKFSVAAVVQVAVRPKNAADLPTLVDSLRKLSQSDSLVKVSVAKTGEHLIAGAGKFHLDVCLDTMREDYLDGAEVVVSDPIVSYMETITAETGADSVSPAVVCAKAPNKLNRVYASARPLSAEFCEAVSSGDITMPSSTEAKAFARMLGDTFEEWDAADGRRLWTFGNMGDGVANALVDCTKGVSYLTEVRQHIEDAFRAVCDGGALCGEALRGVRVDVCDAKIHSDSMHRGAGQMIPAARRAMFACELAASPRLLEPMYLVDITVPLSAQSGVFSTLSASRAEVDKIADRVGTPLSQITAFLPVAESFGFTELLRKNTSGQAFPQMKFSHWSLVPGMPLESGSMAHSVLVATRERQGLKSTLPALADYHDRL